MESDLEAITVLIRNRQLFEARRRLVDIKAVNQRVWGLDQQLEQVQTDIAESQRLAAQAAESLQQGNVTIARRLLKQAQARATDLPGVVDQLNHTKQRISQARSLAAQATEDLREGRFEVSWSLAQQAQQLDCGLEGIAALMDQLTRALQAEGSAHQRHQKDRRLALGFLGLFILAVLAGLIAMYVWANSSSAQLRAVDKARSLHYAAIKLVVEEDFEGAKRNLIEALEMLKEVGEEADKVRGEIQSLLASDSLAKGADGLVPFEGQWVTRERRQATINARAALRTEIDSLRTMIESIRDGKVEGIVASIRPDDRAALMKLLHDVGEIDRLVDTNVTDAGSRFEALTKECLDTLARQGFRKLKGRWMTEAAAFAQEQQDKGLVFHDGQWVTPAEKEVREMTAKGLVRVDNEWITPAERDRRHLVKQQKEAAERAAREQEAVKQQLARERDALKRVLPQYRDFAREARRIRTHFTEGVNFNAYGDRLALLVDAYSLIDDDRTLLRKDADRVLAGCKAVRTIWTANLNRLATDGDVSTAMAAASAIIDSFLRTHEFLSE